MTRRKRFTVAAVAAVLASPTFAQMLSQEDVETLLRGKTFNTEDFGGTGTYRFGEGGDCSVWTTLRTEEKCFQLNKTGETTWEILNLDGSFDSRLTAM